MVFFWVFCCAAMAFCSATTAFPLPAGKTLILGSLKSSGLWYATMSCSSSFGRYSTMELASMDFPVPGSPMSMTCLFWEAALRMTSTASS